MLLRAGPRPVSAEAACLVVHLVDAPRRQGFACGTTDGHPERGEERLCLERRADDTVVLTIAAFSRPATWWARPS